MRINAHRSMTTSPGGTSTSATAARYTIFCEDDMTRRLQYIAYSVGIGLTVAYGVYGWVFL